MKEFLTQIDWLNVSVAVVFTAILLFAFGIMKLPARKLMLANIVVAYIAALIVGNNPNNNLRMIVDFLVLFLASMLVGSIVFVMRLLLRKRLNSLRDLQPLH